jgi:hypothetical protein
MSRRNVWLSFSEWELICDELKDQNYHPFQLSNHQLKEWKDLIKHYHDNNYTHDEPQHCFNRVGIHPTIDRVTSPKAYNILCREDWRDQDMYYVMDNIIAFAGFIINYFDNTDMNTTTDQWDTIRTEMKQAMNQTDKKHWFVNDIIDLYKNISV